MLMNMTWADAVMTAQSEQRFAPGASALPLTTEVL